MVIRAQVIALLVASTTLAHAEHAKLAEARAALAAVQYDRARPLLLEALQAGTASPDELAELYRLSASTATVLGDRELGEQYYRRWLAIDPAASLPASVAPKLREPFLAAQAYMAAHGRLVVQARRDATGVDITVASDPLAMVARVAVDEGGELAPSALGPDRTARVPLGPGGALVRVVALDEFGNVLVELAASAIAAPALDAPRDVGPSSTPWIRRPLVWGVPAVAFAGLAVGFGLAARSADDELAGILANPDDRFFSEAEDVRARRDRNALVANVGFVAAGAFTVATAIVIATRPRSTPPRAAIAPFATPDAFGVGAVARW